MKNLIILFAAIGSLMLCGGCSDNQLLRNDLKRALDVAVEHEKAQAEYMLDREGELPKTYENGEIVTANIRWWTSGFFPGSLWLLYEHTGDGQLREYAEHFTSRLESLKDYRGTHDLGFMVFCSYGNGYRLTGNEAYKEIINEASASLATRFNPTVGAIRSWNTGRKENPELDYIVIIDNMMNLEMLEWSGYSDIARRHADTTLKNHFREDNSSYHVVTYNELTGEVTDKRTAQGLADESAWARGQVWGLYGYTMMYRVTGEKRYLDQAVKIADYVIPRLPEDAIPNWDFDAEQQMKDSSAGSIMASALIELYGLTDNELYLTTAERQLRSLCSDAYLAPVGENGNFILRHGTGHLPAGTEVDVPLTYGDYYFIEAAMRYLAL
ncbi:MAG: glycoside hydrolase family 88 protein [Rikenellaceae bacterium]|nr:glycoside hydrolase family 88 protein [Alistipes sp.]MDO5487164.1 glycoside hydrolase family 88 protein [Rikenellaceae bacterium]